ncbi:MULTISPECIES: mechanosensitive ion channel family protein [unclassified Rhodococcus (in: high G+C Gram-positive bacteria)]|uniref:mechanosensitive ion channel family protein n=1 Tax=unclassified Rhodococcus (in: high G+C Gram-positive bacteria) TaxID=192944 RepID=UPI0004880B1F|nr:MULTISPECIES: mechanosensitive ion channel family protein [unclassified Rhodococcus (in: high G+C Gram-positive bacteria)]KQU30377.1 mechanosensitive ion channel protein MscS [Rhodococcus sp. Leaf225]KQU44718.1 mechanosensitive ion channel protein MscS [Rhodococcus sp. Leaf258]MDQ1179620.1 small-conductance mechanosensitive channel [Rhodococcus sp. SORGH_AS_0301]MDQ1200923.1 small-conductance mechanosensitive channel [Rhodococcus sp. SORGH_AS_0303]
MYSFDPNDVLALSLSDTGRDWLIQRPLQVLGYALLAVVLRYILHRMIDRFTSRSPGAGRSAAGKPPLLRPLRERAPAGVTTTILNERRNQRARTIGSVLKSAVSVGILVWFVLSALSIVGVNVAPFIASAGIVGVALGFGAQNLVRDFLSGIFMLLEDQYGVGDIVDLGEASGTVETVGLRVTTVRDISGTLWYVRNGEVLRVGNMSQGHAVAVLDLPVSHSADIDVACEVAERTARESIERGEFQEDILEAPQMLGVDAVTSDTVTLRLTIKVRPGRQWAVQRQLHRQILDAFDESGIAAPYPNGRPFGPAPSMST